VYLFDVVVGLSQWSASLASLESLGVPSCVGRPRLDITVVHLSGWMVAMLFGCPCKAPGEYWGIHSVPTCGSLCSFVTALNAQCIMSKVEL
jgi:hypothetical protein